MIALATLETASPGRIHTLFGLSPTALSALLDAGLPALWTRRRQAQANRPDRQRAVGGGRSRRVKPYQEGLLTLVYLRPNGAHAVVGEVFGVSAESLRVDVSRSRAGAPSRLPQCPLGGREALAEGRTLLAARGAGPGPARPL